MKKALSGGLAFLAAALAASCVLAQVVPTTDGGDRIQAVAIYDRATGSAVGPGGTVTQGSTTAGQSGPLVQGAVTTANPTYTTGQTSPLSLGTGGNLRVSDSGVATGADAQANTGLSLTYDQGGTLRLPILAGYYFNGTTWDRVRGNTSGSFSQGNVAAGVTDAGNPVKVGAVVTGGVLPTVTTGNRANLLVDTNGNLLASIGGSGATGADGLANSVIKFGSADNRANTANLATSGHSFNGTTWDRTRTIQGATGDLGLGVGAVAVAPTSSANQGITPVAAASTSGVVLKASAGNVFSIQGVAGVPGGFVQLLNLTSVPADGTTNTPLWCQHLASNTSTSWTSVVPIVASTGAVVVFSSSTCGTSLTKITADYLQGQVK